MSIRNSIAKCKNRINTNGSTRSVYYSKKHDLVFKKCVSTEENFTLQSRYEEKLFNQLTEQEKEIIPIVGVEHFDNVPVIIMHYATVLSQTTKSIQWHTLACFHSETVIKNQLKNAIEILGLYDNSELFYKTVKKYNLMDLSVENVGIYNNQLVIIDCGVSIDMI